MRTQSTKPTKIGNARDVAKHLKCGVGTVYSLARQEKIPAIRIGAAYRFDMDDVLRVLRRPARK
jgi:excisionase family DNA binding protein